MGILDRDRKILWARAHNSCAYCKRPLVEDATDDDLESVVGDEAHIVAQSGKGPRAGLIPDSEIDRYENLILLCKVHHKLIDDQPVTYTVERLREMKREHERWTEEKIRSDTGVAVHVESISRPYADSKGNAPEIFAHVPENTEEIDYVMGRRPWSWEYLLYAGVLQVGLRDVQQESACKPTSTMVFTDKRAAFDQISPLMSELSATVQEVIGCFEPGLLSRALGEPGRPGEFRLVYSIARDLIAVYEKLRNWSISVQTANVPWQVRRLFNILGHMADKPMLDIETYVHQLVGQLNDAVNSASLGSASVLVLRLTCEITADEKLLEEFTEEYKRVYRP